MRENQNEIFSRRLKKLRAEKKINMRQLRDDIEEKEGLTFSTSTYSRWENGSRLPTNDNLQSIARYYNVSTDWLLGKINTRRTEKESRLSNRVFRNTYIPKEDLYQHRGEPVWIDKNAGEWALVSLDEDTLICANGDKLPFYSISSDIYRTPIPYCYAVDAIAEQISRSLLTEYDQIWVEPITTNYAKRQKEKGWCSKSDDKREFENPITKIRYKESEYGITWIAYKDIAD